MCSVAQRLGGLRAVAYSQRLHLATNKFYSHEHMPVCVGESLSSSQTGKRPCRCLGNHSGVFRPRVTCHLTQNMGASSHELRSIRRRCHCGRPVSLPRSLSRPPCASRQTLHCDSLQPTDADAAGKRPGAAASTCPPVLLPSYPVMSCHVNANTAVSGLLPCLLCSHLR